MDSQEHGRYKRFENWTVGEIITTFSEVLSIGHTNFFVFVLTGCLLSGPVVGFGILLLLYYYNSLQ